MSNKGNDYLISLHLDLPPYNRMERSEALKAIKQHCGIPVDYVSKYETPQEQTSKPWEKQNPKPCSKTSDFNNSDNSDNINFSKENKNNICDVAAKNGDLDGLKYARQNGCSWNEDTCKCAAENGDLDVLKWLRENGCPWNSLTCRSAAENGHLEVLKWACLNGCEWDVHICNHAANNGHLEILKWISENNYPWLKNDCMRIAKQNNNNKIIEWFGKEYEMAPYIYYKNRLQSLGVKF